MPDNSIEKWMLSIVKIYAKKPSSPGERKSFGILRLTYKEGYENTVRK